MLAQLKSSLINLNPELPDTGIDEAIDIIKKQEHTGLYQNNKNFHRMLIDGVSITIQRNDETEHEQVKLIDFNNADKNMFLVVNQYTVEGTKGFRRPDMVVFINGIPLVVIELKNPADEKADIFQAYNQLQTYKNEIEDLFVYNAALVISDGVNARVGSLTASEEWFMFWRAIKDETDRPILEYELETLVKGFFHKELFLDYLQNFILYEEDGSSIVKKIAGYHQFHAVREAIDCVTEAYLKILEEVE